MTKREGKIEIEIDRAWEDCRWMWDVWVDDKFCDNGVEDTAKAAMDAALKAITAQSDTEAEAIAAWNTRATKPCYATDYTHDHCKYSVNRGWKENTKFYIPTPTTLGNGTLTAEQVREAIERHSLSYGELGRYFHDASWQAIADELNGLLGSGMCEDLGGTGANGEEVFHCSKCGCILSLYDSDGMNTLCTSFICDYPHFCPECGARIR